MSSDDEISSKGESEKGIRKTYNVYNPINVLIEKNDIQTILLKAGIKNKISKLNLYQNAFVHSSYSINSRKKKVYPINNINNVNIIDETQTTDRISEPPSDCVPLQDTSNERLEWLGDGILQSVVGSYLWTRYPKQDEGFLTKIRSKLVKTESLSKFAAHYSMNQFILMSQYIEEACAGRTNKKILEDTFEAFIGALYIDFGDKNPENGYKICFQFITTTIEQCIDITELIMNDDNYKDQLMRFFQKEFGGKYPIYKDEAIEEKNGIRIFNVSIAHPITKKIVGRGSAQIKKRAEQNAAKDALAFLKV